MRHRSDWVGWKDRQVGEDVSNQGKAEIEGKKQRWKSKGGTGMINSRGRVGRIKSDETRKMKTSERKSGEAWENVRRGGVRSGEQRARKRRRWWEGGHQRSVSACILSAPFWNIQRRITYEGRVCELPANTMQNGSTCLAAYLTLSEAHKWWTSGGETVSVQRPCCTARQQKKTVGGIRGAKMFIAVYVFTSELYEKSLYNKNNSNSGDILISACDDGDKGCGHQYRC